MVVTLTACPHNGTQRELRILLASWHGPRKLTEQKNIDFFQRIILFIEDLRKYFQTEVAVLGGDFNLKIDLAKATIKKPRLQLLHIKPFKLPDEKLMYKVVWPAGYLELQPSFPRIIRLNPPSVTVKDSELEPFNHSILLYRFAINLKETKERENRERGKRGREMVWRQREEEK